MNLANKLILNNTVMNKRNFLKTTLLVASGAVISKSAFRSSKGDISFPGVIYTSKDPGKWSEKVGGHAPKVSIKGKEVTLTTDHTMSTKHYIVRHTLVTESGEVIGEKTFYPEDDAAVSTFQLPEKHSGRFFATSFCNKHDFWVTEFVI